MSLLAASYAAANGLEVVVRVADFRRFPLDAEERRDAFLVGETDEAVVVWGGSNAARSVPSPSGACGSAPAGNAVHRQSIGPSTMLVENGPLSVTMVFGFFPFASAMIR